MLGLRTNDGLDVSAGDAAARRCLRAIAGALRRGEESGAETVRRIFRGEIVNGGG